MAKAKPIFETTFATYTARNVVGQGGSGVVYAATDGDGNAFAVKQLNPNGASTEKLKRSKNEIGFCERSSHRNIVKVLDSGYRIVDEQKCPFYVMPFYDQTLRVVMRAGIDPQLVSPLFNQVLNGVEAAHLKTVWHRDLKPENVLFEPSTNTLVVADFGIAHFCEEELATTIETKPTTRLANFRYAAPEQREKGGAVDQRADIFALGLILNEMFTGDVIQGAAYKTIEAVAENFAYLDRVVERMVQQDPNSRYGSIDEVKKDLIARGNEFVARQKLSKVVNEVIPKHSVDDRLIANPVAIREVDYNNGVLSFELDPAPTPFWVEAFKSITSYSHVPEICHPKMFDFYREHATIPLSHEREAQRIVDLFKDYVTKGNTSYRSLREQQARQAEYQEKEKHKARIKEAELRENLLSNLRL